MYSNKEEENAPNTHGVVLMLSKEARSALIGWESHRLRTIKASLKTKKEGISMNFMQCYAPTNDNDHENKDQFYDRQQSIRVKCSKKEPNYPEGELMCRSRN